MSDLESLLGSALDLGEEGRWDEMATALREVLETHGDEPAVHCWLGVAEREMGMEGIAYERFKAALGLNPEDPHILATAGSGIAAFDDPDAESALRAAAMLGPQVVEARLLYGAYLSREGLTADALRELQAALELAPEDGIVLLELGVARALGGEMETASRLLGEAAVANPDDGWTRILLGLVDVERDDMDEADAELEAGARLLPEDVEAQLLSALASAANDRLAISMEMVERARMRAGPEEATYISEVEDRAEDGPDSAREFLTKELAPAALRERLMVRP